MIFVFFAFSLFLRSKTVRVLHNQFHWVFASLCFAYKRSFIHNLWNFTPCGTRFCIILFNFYLSSKLTNDFWVLSIYSFTGKSDKRSPNFLLQIFLSSMTASWIFLQNNADDLYAFRVQYNSIKCFRTVQNRWDTFVFVRASLRQRHWQRHSSSQAYCFSAQKIQKDRLKCQY